LLRRGARSDRVGDLDEQPRVDDIAKLEVGEAPVVAKAAASGGGGLGQGIPKRVNQRRRRNHRQQVGLGKVALVVGIAFGPPGSIGSAPDPM